MTGGGVLGRIVGAAGAFALASVAALGPAARPAAAADQYEFAYVFGVPDIDQKRDLGNGLLPNQGKMYCVPTAAANSLFFLANNGLPGISGPSANVNDFDYVTGQVFTLGLLMGTDPFGGTSGNGLSNGVKLYMDVNGYPGGVFPMYIAVGGDECDFDDMLAWLELSGVVNFCYGRYKPIEVPGGPDLLARNGGHCVSMVGGVRRSAELAGGVLQPVEWKMVYHDPARVDPDGPADDLTTQSATFSHTANVKPKFGFWQLGSADDGIFRLIDSYQVYFAPFLITNVVTEDTLKLVLISKATSGITKGIGSDPLNLDYRFLAPRPREIDLGVRGRLSDMVLHPARPHAFVVVQGTDEVHAIELASGKRHVYATHKGARRLAIGDDHTLYVTDARGIAAFDRQGRLIRHIRTPDAIDPIGFDRARNRLVAASKDGTRLHHLTPALDIERVVELPGVPGEGRLHMSVASNGEVVLHREGMPDVLHIEIGDSRVGGGVALNHVVLDGARAPTEVILGDDGFLHVADSGAIVQYDRRGQQVAGGFTGIPVGTRFSVSRSFQSANALTTELLHDEPDEREGLFIDEISPVPLPAGL